MDALSLGVGSPDGETVWGARLAGPEEAVDGSCPNTELRGVYWRPDGQPDVVVRVFPGTLLHGHRLAFHELVWNGMLMSDLLGQQARGDDRFPFESGMRWTLAPSLAEPTEGLDVGRWIGGIKASLRRRRLYTWTGLSMAGVAFWGAVLSGCFS
jgi:hypothetical protein